MILRLNKWGNSLGLRIPSQLAAKYKLLDGVSVSVEALEEGLFIQPLKQELSLDYLLEGLRQDQQHSDYFNDI